MTLPLYNSRDRKKAIERLLTYAEDPWLKEAGERAWAGFWGTRFDEAMEKLGDVPETAEFCLNSFLYHWLFDFSLDKDYGTVASRFLGRLDRTLPSSEKLFLERMADSSLRIWEVIAIRPDDGLDLRDLEHRGITTVKERLATHSLATWDILAGRVVTRPEGVPVVEGGLYPFRAMDSRKIKVELEGWRHEYLKMYPAWPARFHKLLSTYIHQLWVDLELLRPPPTLVTTDHDSLIFARTFFDVSDPDVVSAELSASPFLIPQDDGSYVWLESAIAAGKAFGKVLGTVSTSRNRLTLDTFSEARAERGRKFLEELLGEAIRFLATRLEDPIQQRE